MLDTNIKRLKFQEGKFLDETTNIRQAIATSKEKPHLRGRVIIRDEFGNVILEKDNLIVLRGRTFALEKLFNMTITSSSGYKMDLNRQVCLFKVGSGGADVASAPFTPYVPKFSDLDLVTPVPFVSVDANKNNVSSEQNNPSYVTSLTTTQARTYYQPVARTSQTSITDYFCKVFDTTPSWFFDNVNNEVYVHCTLRVAASDARNQYVNELGLFFGDYNATANTYSNIEMFSRICFDTESLTNQTKQLVVDYYIYA
jgi:hypothetical protein